MAYADIGRVDTLLNGEVRKRTQQRLATVCAAKADSIINAYLALVYGVPFVVSTPALVATIADDITVYYLLRSGYFDGVAGNTKETMDAMWDEAIDMLDKIAKGKIVLPDVDPSEATSTVRLAQIDSSTRTYHPYADIGDEKDWIPSANRLEAVADAKDAEDS
jgi:phage gp36-like protein